MISGIVLTHGPIAPAIIEAAGAIVGDAEKIYSLSTSGFSLRSMVENLETLVISEKMDPGVIIMTSLKGGSCWNSAVTVSKKFSYVKVVSGVNLNMFISFMTKREQFELNELTEIIILDAIKGIDHSK
jgi:mannose/fructose-specific phosphotransferase system component IIA